MHAIHVSVRCASLWRFEHGNCAYYSSSSSSNTWNKSCLYSNTNFDFVMYSREIIDTFSDSIKIWTCIISQTLWKRGILNFTGSKLYLNPFIPALMTLTLIQGDRGVGNVKLSWSVFIPVFQILGFKASLGVLHIWHGLYKNVYVCMWVLWWWWWCVCVPILDESINQ